MSRHFFGFARDKGRAGIRNKVLILPVDRYCNQIAEQIGLFVEDVIVFPCLGDMGRHSLDRTRLYQATVGIACNPNVHSVVIIGVRYDFNYPEMRLNKIVDTIRAAGKPCEVLTIDECGGMGKTVLQGQKAARAFVRQATLQQRVEIPLSDISVGIKCGISDGTSGISGNPALGAAMDILVEENGTVIISETTEIIGAEHLLAERATDEETKRRLLEMVEKTENQAKSVGEDIRSINPIPSNIKAGISTLEEKSLGAIAKAGTSALRGVLDHAEAPKDRGLYFMDCWMAGNALLPALAGAGAQITIFQSGGGDMPHDPPVPAINSATVAPVFFMTGNPALSSKLDIGVDYDSSKMLEGGITLADIGEEIIEALINTANGQLTWGETLRYKERVDVWFDGPVF